MRTREEVLAERAAVVAALEKPNLTREQRDRGWEKFDELEEELAEIIEANRKKEAAKNHVEARGSAQVQQVIENTWSILDPSGKRRSGTAIKR